MPNRYFRNTGSTSWALATNWSTTNGGAGDGTIPTAADAVFLTSLSGNLNIGTTAVALSFDCTGYTGTISAASGLTVSGNVTLSAAMTISWTGLLTVNAAATLRSNGKTLPGALTLSGSGTYTLADDWRVTGTFTTSVASKVINGFKLYLGGQFNNLTGGFTTSGTTEIVMNGTGIFTGSSTAILQNNVTIDTLGTITLNPSTIPYNTGTFKYIKGAVITTGNTLTCALPTTFDTNTLVWNNVTFSGAGTYTLLSDMLVSGLFTSSSVSKVINGSTLYLSGGFTHSTSSIVTSGTTNFIMNGTGTIVGGSPVLQNNFTIDTTGTLTFSTTFTYSTGTFRYVKGTVITTGVNLTCSASTTLDTNILVLNNVSFNTVASTITLLSDLRMSGAFSFLTGIKTINGFTLYCGSITASTNTLGTTSIVMNGTGTWSGTGVVGNNLTIDTTGTVTVSGSVNYTIGILKYINGTVVTTGSTLTSSIGATFDTVGIIWNNITFSGATATYTLLSDLLVSGIFTSSAAGTKNVNGANLYISGGLTQATGSHMQGTTNVFLTGTGTWTGASNTYIMNNLTIDTTGTITLSAIVGFGVSTLKYVKGTVITTGNTLQIRTLDDSTLDTGGITWNNVALIGGATKTITLNSPLIVNGTFTYNTGISATFAGTAEFVVNSWNDNRQTTQGRMSLTPGIAYRITNAFTATVANQAAGHLIQSTIPGARATLTLDAGATCNVAYINFTDIDASAGRTIYTFQGIVINSININGYADPIRTIAKSFAA